MSRERGRVQALSAFRAGGHRPRRGRPGRGIGLSRVRHIARAGLVFVFASAFASALAFAARAAAAERLVGGADCALAAGEAGRVAAVPDGGTLVLGDGLVVRLAGLAVPIVGADAGPAAAARETLAALALGRSVELRYGGPRRDRHGRARAHVFLVDAAGAPDLWLERALVEAGRARFASAADDRACLVPLAAAERAARAAGRGLWAVPDYHIRAAQDSSLLQQEGLYELVEGRVLSIGRAGRRIYLNFGRRWTSDFTAEIEAQAEQAFVAAGVPVETFEGRIVRVRGWIEEHGGPLVRITHPEQIEILDEADGGD